MDRSRNRKNHPKKSEIQSDPGTLTSFIYSQIKIQPLYSIQKVYLIGTCQNREKYEASLCIGNKKYVTNRLFDTAREAKKNVLREAVADLEISKCPADVPNLKITKTISDNLSIATWAKTLNNETIALLFKDILGHLVVNKIDDVRYKTCVHHEGPFAGYTSEVDFNGETFKSLGLMTSEDQAEQSAAEICLRTLGYLPEVDSERDLIIQPYQGGTFEKDLGRSYTNKPYIFTSKLSSDILTAFVASWNLMLPPKYYVKYVDSKSMNDNVENIMDCICCIDGKVFEASGPQPENLAIEVAADNAVKYFGISNLHERMEFRKHLYLHRREFYIKERLLSSPPSKKKYWSWSCFARDVSYKECDLSQTVQELVKSPFFQSSLPTVDYQNKMIEAEAKRGPSFRGRLLSELDNLCVADIDATNPNLVTIGNSDFSIKMWVTNGKIYSKQKQCSVDILPGHNIQQLNCEYRALPSLEVYLHAMDCNDLSYPNPPKPVVTSCGVVVLSHESNDVYVLLKQKIDYKEDAWIFVAPLKNLLNKLTQPNLETEATVTHAMEWIDQWIEDDVRLLSEMSKLSLYRLMSKYGDYDSRWNDLFSNSKLPDELQEIQVICRNELKRVEEERLSNYSDSEWELPQSEFLSCFTDTGIHIEGSVCCGMRSLAEMANTKISLRDIEKCTVIDLPVDGDGKRHRGDVSRLYIWNIVEKHPVRKPKDSGPELPDGYTLLGKCTIQHNSVTYRYPVGPKSRYNVQYINLDKTDAKILVPLPGDSLFKSFKRSLSVAVKKAHIYMSPIMTNRYLGESCAVLMLQQRNMNETKYICRLKFATFAEAEEQVCKKALETLGYKIPVESEDKNGEGSVEVEILEADVDVDIDSPYGNIDTDNDVDNDGDIDGDVDGDAGLDECHQTEDVAINEAIDDANVEWQKNEVTGRSDPDKVKGNRKTIRDRHQYAQIRYINTTYNLPPRDVFRLQCGWIILDRATNICPLLKKVVETTQFQNELSRFVSQMDTK